jgi:hypothetical protein
LNHSEHLEQAIAAVPKLRVANGGVVADLPTAKKEAVSVQRGEDQEAVRAGSRTTQNRVVVPGSILKGRTSNRTGTDRRPARTTLPFELLNDFLARTAAMPDPTWLVDRLVPDAGRLFIAATANAGKTFLCLAIAKAAARLGRPVYLVLEEGAAKPTGNRFRSLRFPEDAEVYVLFQHGFTLAQHTKALAERLHAGLEGPAPVVVLDPFASIFAGNENAAEDIGAAVAMLNELVRADPRVLLIVPHHTSKAGERDEVGTPMHAARGSTALPAWADVQLNLKHVPTPQGAGLVEFDALMAKNRDGERDYTYRVTIALGTGEVSQQIVTEAKREKKAADLRERMISFVKESNIPLTKNKICDGIAGGGRAEKLQLIDDLTTEGVFKNDGAGWAYVHKPEARGAA